LKLKKEYHLALKAVLGAGRILQRGFQAPKDYRLVEEAGGRATDFSGRPGPLFKKQILATNGLLHQERRELLNIEGESNDF
jgi:hypothetical protein